MGGTPTNKVLAAYCDTMQPRIDTLREERDAALAECEQTRLDWEAANYLAEQTSKAWMDVCADRDKLREYVRVMEAERDGYGDELVRRQNRIMELRDAGDKLLRCVVTGVITEGATDAIRSWDKALGETDGR